MTEPPAADAGRVVEMHRHVRRGLAVSLAFALASVAAAIVPDDTATWLPLHLFLVGSVTPAISVVTLMLAVTWSGSPAPPRSVLAPQRWTLAAGAALVAIGRATGAPAATVIGGVFAAGSLAAVAWMLLQTRRAARTPRFAPAIDAYVLAIGAAIVGISLGIGLTTGGVSAAMRDTHVIVNLLAFVGVVVAATLPYFTATQARTRMTPRARPAAIRAVPVALWLTAAAGAAASAIGHDRLVAASLLGYGIGVSTTAALLPRVGAKQLDWAGPRLLQLFAGVAWWSGTTCWLGVTRWSSSTVDGVALRTLVIGGFAQILTASLAYIVPVVRGGGHVRLGAGFRRTRSWVGLAAGNAAALLAALDERRLLAVALGVWAVDLAVRIVAREPTT